MYFYSKIKNNQHYFLDMVDLIMLAFLVTGNLSV